MSMPPRSIHHASLRPASCDHVGLHVVFFLLIAYKFCAEPPPPTHTQSVPLWLIPGLTQRIKNKEGQNGAQLTPQDCLHSYGNPPAPLARFLSCCQHSWFHVCLSLSETLPDGPGENRVKYDDHVDRRIKRGRPYEAG